MNVEEFVQWLRDRDRQDIEDMVHALSTSRESADGEVCRLRATRELALALRRGGRARQAGEAAHRATVAVLGACTAAGLLQSDPAGVTMLARAAGDAAVGLVVGEQTASADAVLRPFFGSMLLTAS